MFKRILVPVDLTKKSRPALEISLKLAIQNDAHVTLLHVIERIDHVSQKELGPFYKKLEASAQRKINNYAKMIRDEGMAVSQVITYGKRVREILRYASENKIDVIILSSHKVDPYDPRQGWETISYAVGILSQCPVLLVK